MASLTQTGSSADSMDFLPAVQVEVRHGARSATYTLDGIDFLVGSVPGCDLRVAAEASAVLCLFARHPGGLSLRKLAPTQTVLVNGQSVAQCELADGDCVQIGPIEFRLQIGAVRQPANLDQARAEFQERVEQFREQLVRFQHEKEAFERGRQQAAEAVQAKEQQQRDTLLEVRAFEIERQQQELTKVRQEMADQRRQLFDHYQDRRDRLAAMQDDLEKTRADLDAREKKLHLEEEDGADRRQRDRQRQDELDQHTVELTQRALRFEEERRQFDKEHQSLLDAVAARGEDIERREQAVAERNRTLDQREKEYETDVLRLNRLQGSLEARDVDVRSRADVLDKQRAQLETDTREVEEQLRHLDEWRVKLNDEAERLAVQKQEQEDLARQLAERGASLEGQQATLTVLRSRLERMREEIRAREQQVDEHRARQEIREAEMAKAQAEIEQLQREMENDQRLHALDRSQWLERSAVMEAAVRQLKEAKEKFAAEEDRLRRDAGELDEQRHQFAESDGILQGRLAQLAQAQEHLDLERQALQQRSVNILQREQACAALQEQLHRRSGEMSARHQEITDRLQTHQTRFAELDARGQQLNQREAELQQQIDSWRRDLEAKAAAIQQKHAEIATFEDTHQDQLNQLAVQRKTHADERAQFHLEQQTAVEKLAQTRTELQALRGEAQAFLQHLPDAELRAGAAVDRLGQARAQLRAHLDEIHAYVRQCQDELGQLRGKLQADLDKLQEQEQALRRSQDDHRLAMVAFRQQIIDWQAQITEHKNVLARGATRLERKEAQVDERAREMDAKSEQLAQQAVQLEEQEREVADRREEMDRHLVDMRQWYRQKLRELAGIPLIPDTLKFTAAEPPLPSPSHVAVEGEDGIVPTGRNILSITGAVDAGDQKLGQVLRASQLIDGDTLTALLAEARRQRRSLRQVLLASGVITLYQLALIEAGNVDGLMLGPVRIIDRLRHTTHETVYRVFDPRRGCEAVLRHLAEADMTDAVKPDEFRQRFGQAMLNDPHLANTLEVLELSGRPAAVQEWLAGLPASDWPPLAAAPGVCYRLLTQAAQGLATAHQAGVVHGHLADALLLLTGDGVLKICGIGEPPWLVGLQYDEEPTPRDDLRTLGKIVSGWCTPTGVRKGAKTKPLPDALVSVLYRLAADGDAGYRDVKELLDDLQKAAAAIPANAEAWERLLKYVREHGAAEAVLRQSA
jgi:hypothetical protein